MSPLSVMKREPIQSKALVSLGYDEAAQILEIEFKNGRVYQYHAVPKSLYEWLLRVKKKGGIFQRLVRDKFKEVEVTPPLEQDLLAALQASVRQDSEDD